MWSLFCFIFLLLLFWYSIRSRTMSLLKRCGIPGPEPNFILGNALQMAKFSPEVYQKHLIEIYGKVVGYYIGAQPTILVTDLELIKNIQTQDFKTFLSRPTIDFNFLTFEKEHDGALILTTGQRWRNTRQLMTPSFSPSKLKAMIPLIEGSVDTFIDIIGKNAEKEIEFNFHPLAQSLMAEMSIKNTFGVENNIQINSNNQILEDVSDFMATPINMKLYLLVNCFPWLFSLLYHVRKLDFFSRECILRLCKTIKAIIKLRKDSSSSRRNDILQALIDSTIEDNDQDGGKRLTENEIAAITLNLYAAAYDTTSITLANVAHHLVNYPEVQEKVRQEVQELYESKNKLDFNGVDSELQLLDCVIKETLRLYPPVVFLVSRECLQDYKYRDMTIPKGSTVMIPVLALHYDEEYWPSPDMFDPMRFSPERKHEILPFSFQAFGDGPRNCIGIRLSYLEMKLLVAKLLLHFRLERGPKTEIGKLSQKLGMGTFGPKHGVFVKAVKI